MLVPRMSEGIRSGVNWMRANETSKMRASVRTESVLAVPGTPSRRTCPPASSATVSISTSSCCPTTALCISSVIRSARICTVRGGPTGNAASVPSPKGAGTVFATLSGLTIGGIPPSLSDKVESPPEPFQSLRQIEHLRLAHPLASHDLFAARKQRTQGFALRAVPPFGLLHKRRCRQIGRQIQRMSQFSRKSFIQRDQRNIACARPPIEPRHRADIVRAGTIGRRGQHARSPEAAVAIVDEQRQQSQRLPERQAHRLRHIIPGGIAALHTALEANAMMILVEDDIPALRAQACRRHVDQEHGVVRLPNEAVARGGAVGNYQDMPLAERLMQRQR